MASLKPFRTELFLGVISFSIELASAVRSQSFLCNCSVFFLLLWSCRSILTFSLSAFWILLVSSRSLLRWSFRSSSLLASTKWCKSPIPSNCCCEKYSLKAVGNAVSTKADSDLVLKYNSNLMSDRTPLTP